MTFYDDMQYIGYMKSHTFIKTIQRTSLSEQVYQSLRTAIISLELEPGQKIRDMELAEQFNVSRTPIREALKRLEAEGLIMSEPGSITRVSEINVEEVKQAFVVVATLHSLAARLAISQLTTNDFELLESYNEELNASIREKDMFKAMTADDYFHGVFLKASQNNEIHKALERLMPKLRRLEFKKFDSKRAMNSVFDHKKIIKASRSRDVSRVSILVEQNWLSLGDQLIP